MKKLFVLAALAAAVMVGAATGAHAANGLFVNTGNPSDGLLDYHVYGTDPDTRGFSFDGNTTSNPIWGLGLETTYGDLYLQSYTTALNMLEMRGDTGQLNLGKGIGRPVNGGAQLGITAGTLTAPLGGIGVTTFGSTFGLSMGQGKPGTNFTAISYAGLFQLGTDVAGNGGGDFSLWDLAHSKLPLQVNSADLVTMNYGATINGTTTMNGPVSLLGSSTTIGSSGALLGFYGTTPVTRPVISGSRSDGTALRSLLQNLQAMGLITDNTTP